MISGRKKEATTVPRAVIHLCNNRLLRVVFLALDVEVYVAHCHAPIYYPVIHCRPLGCIAIHCHTLSYTVTQCQTLHTLSCTAMHLIRRQTPSYTVEHCHPLTFIVAHLIHCCHTCTAVVHCYRTLLDGGHHQKLLFQSGTWPLSYCT